MKILVIGGGGREHAIAFALSRSQHAPQLFVAPGNPGIAALATCVDIPVDNINKLLSFAQTEKIDMTIVGPELPLSLGVVDTFRNAGLPIMGPTRMAAQLESSKSFAKSFMDRHHIPTAKWGTFTDIAKALHYLKSQQYPVVIKADGLAAGKGVVIAQTADEAQKTLSDWMGGKQLGGAGQSVVIEEFLQGREISMIAIADGEKAVLLQSAADHKRAYDGDQGPNTGGMGAVSPVPWVNAALVERVRTEILEPTIAGMALDGMPFSGFLYMGIMVVGQTPHVLEYNVRLGDPEAQALLPRLQTDFVELCGRSAAVALYQQEQLKWDSRSSVCVVMAAEGYPGTVVTGSEIQGIPSPTEDAVVFQAGTCMKDEKLQTAGGRVLGVTALGDTLEGAQYRAYDVAKKIRWKGAWYRHDIGKSLVKL
ncbi:MAG: phosphoribosylamine--glycine ligase [Deltaproteobacteria bacterium CG11_big_fil_rev_8_21_14_0_20_47_16]|nr:MAG: phosphoribosylamine--glycine ligase [Deltaproteobacteria bacterium CG11_big_fil_rev_8_21_14_0_20_47_16]